MENGDLQVHASIDQRPCEVEHHGCSGLSFSDLNWTRHAVEPKTGIELPIFLDNILARQEGSILTSEVDVYKFHVITLSFCAHVHYVLAKLDTKDLFCASNNFVLDKSNCIKGKKLYKSTRGIPPRNTKACYQVRDYQKQLEKEANAIKSSREQK